MHGFVYGSDVRFLLKHNIMHEQSEIKNIANTVDLIYQRVKELNAYNVLPAGQREEINDAFEDVINQIKLL